MMQVWSYNARCKLTDVETVSNIHIIVSGNEINLIANVTNCWKHAGTCGTVWRHKSVYTAPGWRQFAVTPVPDNHHGNGL